MLNQLVLVGRITKTEKITNNETIVKIGVPRSFKNTEGIYETDYIKVKLYNELSKNINEYCKKGDLIGIKGRIETDLNCIPNIIAEKVTFLSSSIKSK